jgi:hypothetical protein
LWVDLGEGLVIGLGAVVGQGGMVERYWMTLLVLEGRAVRQCSVSGRDCKRSVAIGKPRTRDRISRTVHGCQCRSRQIHIPSLVLYHRRCATDTLNP